MNWQPNKREQLARFTPKEIVQADHDLLLGATNALDGMLSPGMTEITSADMIELMDDEQVGLLLFHLNATRKEQ